MNILIINTNTTKFPTPVIPIGACMIAETAQRAGYRVRLLDLMFERDPLRAIQQSRDGGVRLAFLHLASSHTWLNAYVQA